MQMVKDSGLKKILGVLAIGVVAIGVWGIGSYKYKSYNDKYLDESVINKDIENGSVAMYIVDGMNETKVDKLPTGKYAVIEDKSYCNVNGVKDNDVEIKTIDGKLTFSNFQKGSKCWLYFEEDNSMTIPELVASSSPTTCPTSFTGPSDASEARLCSGAQDQDGDTYYFRGSVTNNWVKFGKDGDSDIYWRIIRINGDGSIRMIYNGTSTTTTGETTQIGKNAFNLTYNSAEYVGLQYTIGEQRGTGTNSTILGTTDSTDATTLYGWYNTKIKGTNYEKYVDTNAVFCSDRDVASGHSSYPGTTGTGTTETMFGPGHRAIKSSGGWNSTQAPVMTCATNNQLRLPIGLITSDEVGFAGGFAGSTNSNFYLYTNNSYWTMSPSYLGKIFDTVEPYVFIVSVTGIFAINRVDYITIGVRPVINLKADTKLTGSGSTTSPYVVLS